MIDLEKHIRNPEGYFESQGRVRDYEGTNAKGLVSDAEYELAEQILFCEAAIFTLNRMPGAGYWVGNHSKKLWERLVVEYEELYGRWVVNNDFLL